METAPNIEEKRRAARAALSLHAVALRWLVESLTSLPQDEQDAVVARARRADSWVVPRQKEVSE
jgi:hypothetical protein